MSLINEALKRTRDTSFQSPANRFDTASVYHVNGSSPASAVGSRSGMWATLVIAVIALAVGTILASRIVKHARSINDGFAGIAAASDKSAPSSVVSTKPAPTPPQATGIDSKTADDKLVTKVVEKVGTEQADAAVAPSAAPAPPPQPELPKLVLQGVTSEGNAREAMINGVNVREGDDIEGARVVSIESHRVKLQFDQRDILLRIP
jgi:hypothetical protein